MNTVFNKKLMINYKLIMFVLDKTQKHKKFRMENFAKACSKDLMCFRRRNNKHILRKYNISKRKNIKFYNEKI